MRVPRPSEPRTRFTRSRVVVPRGAAGCGGSTPHACRCSAAGPNAGSPASRAAGCGRSTPTRADVPRPDRTPAPRPRARLGAEDPHAPRVPMFRSPADYRLPGLACGGVVLPTPPRVPMFRGRTERRLPGAVRGWVRRIRMPHACRCSAARPNSSSPAPRAAGCGRSARPRRADVRGSTEHEREFIAGGVPRSRLVHGNPATSGDSMSLRRHARTSTTSPAGSCSSSPRPPSSPVWWCTWWDLHEFSWHTYAGYAMIAAVIVHLAFNSRQLFAYSGFRLRRLFGPRSGPPRTPARNPHRAPVGAAATTKSVPRSRRGLVGLTLGGAARIPDRAGEWRGPGRR